MAGGGQMQNPYQQVGRGGRGGMRQMAGMNPNQPILQRQIGTMGPGAGMAPTQTGLGAQGTLVPPSMGMAPMQGQISQPTPADMYARQMMINSGGAGYNLPQLSQQQMMERLQQQMPQQMPPGFERQFVPLTAQNPYSAMPQQVPQADPRMEYMKQLYSGQQNQQQIPQPMPRQIGRMGPGAGLASALGIAGLPRG